MRQDRLLEIVGRIVQRPETWDQTVYRNECGTAFCIAGHAHADSLGGKQWDRGTSCWDPARDWLGLSETQAGWLFDGCRTLGEIVAFALNPVSDPWEGL